MDRRRWLGMMGASLIGQPGMRARAAEASGSTASQNNPRDIYLSQFDPKSMLRAPETKITEAKFPVIDMHTHISWSAVNKSGVPVSEKMKFLAQPHDLLAVMDRRNIRTLVDLTGGFGQGVVDTIQEFHAPHPDRFIVFTEPWYPRTNQPGYPQFQAEAIERAHKAGARGLKILKTLGLYLRENITWGALVKIDDRRFDPMWEACGSLGMPVFIHTSDPDAFFLPTNRFNERFEELSHHPDWSFYGRDYPSKRELLNARNRVFARHPRTQFVALHVANHAEDLADVSELLDRLPNVHVGTAARINELGRQPRNSRKFFDKYQDRIMFGTDAVPIPYGAATPQQVFGDKLYEIYCRFFETEDEYFDYAPAPKPPQGRWQVAGIGLPDDILRKVYYQNAARLLRLKA
ncbi:MAG TPA: amidohydrolase family protein [Terriglobia bacterium]|nr:amidohydrolase family protein [Terriglobia bacterium]